MKIRYPLTVLLAPFVWAFPFVVLSDIPHEQRVKNGLIRRYLQYNSYQECLRTLREPLTLSNITKITLTFESTQASNTLTKKHQQPHDAQDTQVATYFVLKFR
jgi:hypothetical protein